MSGFVDEAQVHAKGGDGGAGAVSFRREAHVARGGPDGGDGGSGGDVWLVASSSVASLLAFRDHPHRRAGDGKHGSGKRRRGARGLDSEVPVPVGTVVRERDGAVLADLGAPGERCLVAAGGRGGWGNAHFLSNRRRAPGFAEQGEHGEERWLNLELKLVADVALVGFPNAGKSTLISVVSAAKPKIADYPFTTLEPHLGLVRSGTRVAGRSGADEQVEFVMADVPGLVEGAADGRGLGHRFLRHVERARVLLVLLDPVAQDERLPADQLAVLVDELGRYRPELLERPRLVAVSKADLFGEDVNRALRSLEGSPAQAPSAMPSETTIAVSAVTGLGLGELVGRLSVLVAHERAVAPTGPETEVVVHRPVPEGVRVVRAGAGVWEVTGREALRAVRFSDLTDEGALAEAVRRLRRLGVDRSLARAGARDGDEVRVGDVSFSWYREGAEGAGR